MNERIRELAVQAGAIEAKHITNIPSVLSLNGEEIEKFAELLIRECANICMEMSAKCAGLPGDGALAKDCAYWIKKDFGVEE